MKTRMVMCAGVMLLVTLSVSGQESKKSERVRKEITASKSMAEVQQDLRTAKLDSAADFQQFRNETEMKIRENGRKITVLQEQKAKPTKVTQENYDAKVAALQQRNNDLKKKIQESDNTKTSNWTLFKREFNHDMDDLACDIRDTGV